MQMREAIGMKVATISHDEGLAQTQGTTFFYSFYKQFLKAYLVLSIALGSNGTDVNDS